MTKRQHSATSNFGSSVRESHDSSAFYDRFRPPTISTDDQVLPPAEIEDPFIAADARHMDAVPDGSVALVVTSPPYFAGKQYEEELDRDGVPSTYLEYLDLLRDVFAECVRKLEPGGRIAVNVANLGRKPYRSLSADVIQILERDLGLLLRGEIIWQKAEGASGSCAWGSFRSASNPVLRDVTERIIIASKGRFDRAQTINQRHADGLPHENTQLTDDFLASTLDVWSIPPESAHRVGHPAPFPVELPERLIRLYTFKGDLVLDPFMGSGSALVAAAQLERRYVGYDTDPDYVEMARRRVTEVLTRGPEGATAAQRRRLREPPLPSIDNSLRGVATTEGKTARNLAREVLEEAGFVITAAEKRLPKTGITISFIAHDRDGGEWFFDLAGSFTSHHGGLLRTDTIWRSLGRASALRGQLGDVPIVVLTTEVPKRRSEGDMALRAAGPDALFDVVAMLSHDARTRLKHYAHGGHTTAPQPGFWTPAELDQR
ncbi:MAG: hypothetical protein CSA55_05085 [Ilumatobacter coccineus]|uniref:Methyltransferase n=1 Tax=Ilumatobacter coccineus TaxID=467094 RepID=A0A2G6K7S3_9ACTN|nr:MAG: hypothetical protein CSA55_05085 [Ilumatobacter coccineus]